MGRKLWVIFFVSQIIGVGLASYSSRFQVGIGGVREFLWIPATLLLVPGVLFGYAMDALTSGNRFSHWHGLPFFAMVILLNAAFWNLIVLFVRRLKSTTRSKA